ncbi:cephalosporin hydroxylase family protein [Pseudogemmobacter sp. W21_MBD1_M6]|uniref:cephalosporin hydroxylase family protein n=1 Tax=Pseudogemmobacter sp. W21_MBD1_M6 TaxID=3240271 RepID=UPI003F96AAEB
MTDFEQETAERIASYEMEEELKSAAHSFMVASTKPKYSYNFSFLGRPIIQYPQDMVAVQELIWNIRPDLIIETGIAHGGSLVMSAAMLAMMDMCDAIEAGTSLDPAASRRKVLGIDIDIRPHNRQAIDAHPMRSRIEMIQGSSIDPSIVSQVKDFAKGYERVLVFLDSNHTHDHVLEELRAYAPLTSKGSYCVVFDTIIEDVGEEMYPDRPWGPGDNPKTAVHAFLKENGDFEIDRQIDLKILISVAPNGFLRRLG